MKAIVYHRYGSPDVLQLEEVDRPTPDADEVLIKVEAAATNPLDWHFMRGSPLIMRPTSGWFRPKHNILGADVAGTVEAIGDSVTQHRVGDAVIAESGTGAFAEFLSVPEDHVVTKPANVSFEEAAALPVAGLTALQGLRDHGGIQAGHKVLINGAAGGVGTFAVQIAKSFGAEVTGVCSTRNLELVASLGADRVIDYTKQDFTKDKSRFDLVLDAYGNHSLSEYRRILEPQGVLVAAAGPILRILRIALFGRNRMKWFIANPNRADLTLLKELLETEQITSVIDRRYPLREVPDAIRYLEEGHARGKVIITG